MQLLMHYLGHLFFHSICITTTNWKVVIIVEYVKSNFASNNIDDHLKNDKYNIKEGLIFYKNRIFIIPNSKFKDKLIIVVHDTLIVGHSIFLKTYRKLNESFTWEELKYYIIRHVREFATYQENKVGNTLLTGLLYPFSIPN